MLENEDVTSSVKQFSSPCATPKESYEAFRGGADSFSHHLTALRYVLLYASHACNKIIHSWYFVMTMPVPNSAINIYPPHCVFRRI